MSSKKRHQDKKIRQKICQNVDKIIKNNDQWSKLTDEELGNIFSEKPNTLRAYRGFNVTPSVSLEFLVKFSYLTNIPIDDLIKKIF